MVVFSSKCFSWLADFHSELKLPFGRDFPLPCLITRRYAFVDLLWFRYCFYWSVVDGLTVWNHNFFYSWYTHIYPPFVHQMNDFVIELRWRFFVFIPIGMMIVMINGDGWWWGGGSKLTQILGICWAFNSHVEQRIRYNTTWRRLCDCSPLMMWRTQQGTSNKSRVLLCRPISLDMKKETIVVIYPVNIIDIGHLTRF
jgi:hypothetical protein